MTRLLAAAALAALACAGAARADQTLAPSWLKADPAQKTVALDIVAGWNPNNGALNFNGYYQADATLVLPPGWTVKTTFVNHDGMLPHSLLVTKQYPADDIPPQAGVTEVAINKAYTDNPESGLPPNGHDSFTFRTPAENGSYWLFCGVPGHGVGGMYVNLRVDSKAQAPVLVVADSAAPGRP